MLDKVLVILVAMAAIMCLVCGFLMIGSFGISCVCFAAAFGLAAWFIKIIK